MRSDLKERCAREAENYWDTLHRCGWTTGSQLDNEFLAAWAAVLWFAESAPSWARQPLLLDPEHLLDTDSRGMPTLIRTWPDFVHANFSVSIWCHRYRYWKHPDIERYGAGLMADPRAPKELRENPVMRELLPPKHLDGLDAKFCWRPLR